MIVLRRAHKPVWHAQVVCGGASTDEGGCGAILEITGADVTAGYTYGFYIYTYKCPECASIQSVPVEKIKGLEKLVKVS